METWNRWKITRFWLKVSLMTVSGRRFTSQQKVGRGTDISRNTFVAYPWNGCTLHSWLSIICFPLIWMKLLSPQQRQEGKESFFSQQYPNVRDARRDNRREKISGWTQASNLLTSKKFKNPIDFPYWFCILQVNLKRHTFEVEVIKFIFLFTIQFFGIWTVHLISNHSPF